MASNVDDLTIEYEEDGVVVVKVLDKIILSRKGAWATILFRYQQWENAKEAYSADKYSIRRYRKTDDEYRQQAKFNISNKDQALKIIEALQTWMAE
jgi:predicted neuraminidase